MRPSEDGFLPTNPRTDNRKSITESRWSAFNWWREITAIIIGLIALFAIVATLYPHQGKPLPQWPFGISINTLLSIYSFVLKAVIPVVVGSCLCQLQWTWFSVERPLIDVVRYDSAAKGPLGSIAWLWANHISQPLTALGALLTIASVIIDPFVQQLVFYHDCYTTLGGTASIPRTNYLEYQGIDAGLETQIVSPGVQSAIEAGLFGSPEVVDADCSTGNCTFPEQYASLGYCSACQNISDLVEIGVSNTIYDDNLQNPYNITTYNSTLPSGLSTIWTEYKGAVFAGALVNYELQFLQGATFWSFDGEDPSTGDKMVGCNNTAVNETAWKCQLANAVSCKLTPCIRVYNASVSGGKLTESMVDSSGVDQEWGAEEDYIYSIIDTQCTTSQENSSLSQLGYNLNGRWLAYNSTISEANYTQSYPIDAPFPYSLYAHQCVYSIDFRFVGTLLEGYINGLFTGNLTASVSEIGSITDIQGLQSLQKLYNYSDTNFQFIENVFHNMSESFTSYIRLNGAINQSIPATGQVLHYATCLNVNWHWIILPASVLVGTVVLLALTIVKAYRDGVPIWKTSILPIIFNGPGLNLQTSLTTEKSMEKEAAKINVILYGDAGEGYTLLRTSL